LAIRYPNVSFFLDHAGRSFAAAEENAYYAKKYPNIYLQLTYTTVPQGIIEYLCSEGLADKVLYGTDAPMRDPRPQLTWITYADISVEDKKKILGGNMLSILERCFNVKPNFD
ncbi:MAG: amidohydrolase family protein, partial [Clostridiales bacterium]|nr:amidohydrolase family protein [Clostridiales bacterium]